MIFVQAKQLWIEQQQQQKQQQQQQQQQQLLQSMDDILRELIHELGLQ